MMASVLVIKAYEPTALVENEAGIEASETVMSIPLDLVPKVCELIAKRQS
jgi:hypothetical protein